MLVDIHAHLGYEDYYKDDLDEVIKRSKQKDVRYIITSGTTHKENIRALELSKKYDIVEASLGLYPTFALQLNEKQLQESLDFIKKNKKNIFAIGEIGLDYYEDSSNMQKQKDNFNKILELAEELKLPIIVHSRKAELDVIEILETTKIKNIIMHCFSGNFKLVKRIDNNNWFFSIPANIVHSEHFQKMAKEISLNKILTETDCPFLSPIRGKRNEPMNVEYTINKIAEIKNITSDETKKIIFMNFQKIFLK